MNYEDKVTILIEARDEGHNVAYVPNGTNDSESNNLILDLHRFMRFTVNSATENTKIAIDEMMMYHFPGDYPVIKYVPNNEKFNFILSAMDKGINIYLDVAESTFIEFASTFGDVIDNLDGDDQKKLNDIYNRFKEAAGSIEFSNNSNVHKENESFLSQTFENDGLNQFPVYQLDLETKLNIDENFFYSDDYTKSRVELRAFPKFQLDLSNLIKFYSNYNNDPSHSIDYLALNKDIKIITEIIQRYISDLNLHRFGYEEYNTEIETKLVLLDMAIRYRYSLGLKDSKTTFSEYYNSKMSEYPYYMEHFKANASYTLPSLAFPFDSIEDPSKINFSEELLTKFNTMKNPELYRDIQHLISTIELATKPDISLLQANIVLGYMEQRAVQAEINLYLKNRLRDAYLHNTDPNIYIIALNALYNNNLEISKQEGIMPFDKIKNNSSLDFNYIRTGKLALSGLKAVEEYSNNVLMHGKQGHGFAAEYGNDLIDSILGADAKLIGSDNAKHGADRLVNGEYIQTKYCKTGAKSISECFENNRFKYQQNGKPMLIEVPKDSYDDAIKAMEKRIINGELKEFNITNPEDATSIVRKGHLSYKSAQRIAKAGTIESITYDTAKGMVSCSEQVPLTFLITFSSALWQGEDAKDALKIATEKSIKNLGIQATNFVITQQIGRTSIENALRPVTNFASQSILGIKNSSQLANSFFNNPAISANNFSKLMRGNVIVTTVTTIYQSKQSISDALDCRISGTQLIKDLTVKGAGVAAGLKGAQIGFQLGSAIPGVGNVIGAITGYIAASYANTLTEQTTNSILNFVIEDDSVKLLAQLKQHFISNIEDLNLDRDEINYLSNYIFGNSSLSDDLKDMYASNDSFEFVSNWMDSYIIAILKARPTISSIESVLVI